MPADGAYGEVLGSLPDAVSDEADRGEPMSLCLAFVRDIGGIAWNDNGSVDAEVARARQVLVCSESVVVAPRP
ncbi:MAG: hypothetical protein ACK5KU_12110 [Beutenbergiaceae bacterium]